MKSSLVGRVIVAVAVHDGLKNRVKEAQARTKAS